MQGSLNGTYVIVQRPPFSKVGTESGVSHSSSENPNDAVIPIISMISATEVSLAVLGGLSMKHWSKGE